MERQALPVSLALDTSGQGLTVLLDLAVPTGSTGSATCGVLIQKQTVGPNLIV